MAGREAGAFDLSHRHLPLVRYEHQTVVGMAIRTEILHQRGANSSANVRKLGP